MNVHAEFAVQERIDLSIGSGDHLGQDLLETDANTTMDHVIVPKSIDRLRLPQDMPANNKKEINKNNMQNM